MNEADALELMRSAIWAIIIASGPPVLTAMVVGVVIALFQALTQVQEMTLTFVPKIVAVFVVILLTATFVSGQVLTFSEQVYGRIERGF